MLLQLQIKPLTMKFWDIHNLALELQKAIIHVVRACKHRTMRIVPEP